MLDSIIQNVEANEALYTNLELIVRRDIRPSGDLVAAGQCDQGFEYETVRMVDQAGMYYVRRERPEAAFGKGYHTHEDGDDDGLAYQADLAGFDGALTRSVKIYFNSGAEFRHWRYEVARILRPHTMICFSNGIYFPLSTYLRGNEAVSGYMASDGCIRTAPTFYARMKFAWAVAGNETIGDQQRIKLRSIQSDWCDSPTVYILDTLWLAPQLNYLPVRRELDMRNYSWIWPFCVYQADDFREIRPGIWLPFHLKKSPYDWAALDEHRDVARELDEYTVLRADLNPKYEIDLFREIPVPTGMSVEEREPSGCLMRRYVEGQGSQSSLV